ncbi:hypothetical protein CWI38_1505p0020 [Hamiltosporidium tvaerminnensis]|uniref:Uncharacterized protein n=1 Tax=Hamiltosporidium tvaerminnensis TaxID=1176355 RepID=A0A4Q9LRZ7_9MICR|nr:hypothetical protein CWI38_1505p0020 [Hamiltosporidium tvaerminnensis]
MEKEISKEEVELYDRQIRIFGFETQKKLLNFTVLILDQENKNRFIAGEIIKNFVLLGVKKIGYNKYAFDSFEKLSPIKITEINENIICDIVNHQNVRYNDYSLTVFIDLKPEVSVNNCVFICSKCFSFYFLDQEETCKENCGTKESSVANDCLLGAIFVQEAVKKIKGDIYLSKYTLDLN